jgi:starch phosphorylase
MGDGGGGSKVGKNVRVQAVVSLGGLSAADVTVELYCGSLDSDGQLNDGHALPMQQIAQESGNRVRYSVDMPCDHSGLVGYTVRVLPRHDLLASPHEMAMIRWA